MRSLTWFLAAALTAVLALSFLGASSFELSPAKASDRSADSKAAGEAARQNNLGVAYMNQQLFEKALKNFEAAIAADPKSSLGRLNRAIALLNLQRVDEAKALLDAAVLENPKNPTAWYNLGLLYKNSGDVEKAVDAFRHVTEIDANDADTWYFLGSAHLQARQFPEAIASFEHAIKLNPTHASAWFGLSRAFQQSGDTVKAREHLVRFQQITSTKVGTAMSLAYGEQGKYSKVVESASVAEHVPDAIAVKFVAFTEQAGLVSHPAGDASDIGSFLGSGACFLDYDGDGKMDLFLADAGPAGGMSLYHNLGNGKFADVTKQAGLDPALHGIGCTAGDYDNDGLVDLAVSMKDRVLLLHNEKDGKFKDVSEAAGIKSEAFASGVNVGLTFVDYDHDGDIDLYVSRYSSDALFDPRKSALDAKAAKVAGANLMFRNNGNGTFTDVTADLALQGTGPSFAAVGSDANNDRAVDLVTTAWHVASPTIYDNPREGKFAAREPWAAAMPAPAVAISVLDFDKDGWMDLAFTHWGSPALTLWRSKEGKSFQPVALPPTNWVRAWGVAALDFDNDGWIDLVAVGETAEGRGEVRLFRNLGVDGFKDVTADVGLDKVVLKEPRGIVTADYDNDGATDLLITQNHGPAVLLRNEGGNQNHWLRLAFRGLNDNRSAIGTKVEVFAGASRQKWEIAGSSGYLGQSSTVITAGLGDSAQADIVRMLWPTGVLQDEIEVDGGKEQAFIEIDRRGSSCPTLFAWDGEKYRLIADVLGAGVLGHWVAPGERNIPRATEYVKVDRDAMRLRDGKLSFRLMEPMEEVVYLDRVRLLAIDHSAGVEVYPNEFFAANPPYPSFKVITTHDAKAPAGVWDERGRDLLPDLLAHKYVGNFDLLPFKGFTKLHSLELDLGEKYDGAGPLRLLLHGEIEYFTATGMYAASQAGVQATSPYVEAQNARGEWVRVIDDMGFPAGLPRTMVADLSGKLPVGTRRIRISTNLQIYWDSILVDRTAQDSRVAVHAVRLERAQLGFHGYPRQTEGVPAGNVHYVYEDISSTGPYARQAGTYTRYGDVRPLLTGYDDQFAVFGSGEEVALDFDPSALPVVRRGWTRDYFFLANGYEKDMDFYAAEGSTVEPLPFRSMNLYPYPGKAYPLTPANLDSLLRYNTRHLSGNEPRGYAFSYTGKH
jgi:tetratricopeptide (TPR) repeat protein